MDKFGYWFTYGEIENAMLLAFYVDRGTVLPTVLRGRINALQRGGLVPAKTGSGNGIRYSLMDAYELALGLELANLGAPPKVILRAVMPKIFDHFIRVEKSPDTADHLMWIFHPCALFEDGPAPSFPLTEWKTRIGFAQIPFSFVAIDVTEIKDKIDTALKAHVAPHVAWSCLS